MKTSPVNGRSRNRRGDEADLVRWIFCRIRLITPAAANINQHSKARRQARAVGRAVIIRLLPAFLVPQAVVHVRFVATHHARHARRGAGRVGLVARGIRPVPVMAPFHHGIVRAAQSERIRSVGARWRRGARPETVRGAGAAGVFPFGLRRQAIRLAFLAGEPFTESDRVIPTHTCHLAAQREWVLRPELAILFDGNFGHRNLKRARDGHSVRRALVPIAIPVFAHHERAGWDRGQFHPKRVGRNGCGARKACSTKDECDDEEKGPGKLPRPHNRASEP